MQHKSHDFRNLTWFFFVLTFILFQASVFAQDTERDSDVVRRETEAEKKVAQASKQAKKTEVPSEVEPTFKDVLAKPDDVELNFRYAKVQVAKNNILGASATLERILLINPQLDQVRLFHAVVLYRLDNLTEAQSALDLLSKKPIAASLRAEVNQYVKLIKNRKKKTHLDLRESIGFEYDHNRNAAPSSKKRLFGNGLLDLSGSSVRTSDTSFLNITNVDVSHDLGFQAGHELLASFTYFKQEQTVLDSLDLSAYQLDLGGVYKTQWFNFTPMFHASVITLSRETFLRTQGGSFTIDRSFGKLDVYTQWRMDHQDFVDITENLASHERRGNEMDWFTGASYPITSTMIVSSALGYSHKRAKNDYNAYDRLTMDFAHTWLLGKGQFLINDLTTTFDEYDEPDTAIASVERHDRTLRYRLTYGAPFSFFPILKKLPAQLRDITMTASYEYYRAFSNVTNYTYTNNKFLYMLSKKWEF